MIVFTPGTTLSCFDIAINDDESLENIELFTVSLESADPNVVIGPLSFTTVMILDNDGMMVTTLVIFSFYLNISFV